MRKLLSFIFSVTLAITSAAQDAVIDSLAERVALYAKRYPQETVFLHMDNTCYFQGDTIFYKAYVTRSDRAALTDISQVLYVELLNQDGYLVERQIVRLTKGEGFSSIALPDSAYSGYYELRAYTRWQLNWGRTERSHSPYAEKWFLRKDMAEDFFRDYEKLYSRVFPVYDKPKNDGDYVREMTLRPLQRHYKPRYDTPKPEVSFYPEGGALVAGVSQRVAFEALDTDGKYLKGRVEVRDAEGRFVADAETEHRGRGCLDLPALPTTACKAYFKQDGHEPIEVKWPKEEQQGVALRVSQEKGKLKVDVHRTENGPGALGLTLLAHGVVYYSGVLQGNAFEFPLDKLPNGVAQVTLFDANGRVWADRLSFVRHDGMMATNVKVKGEDDSGKPFERVDMEILAGKPATVSVSVRDKALSENISDNGSLLTEMLLASQIKGFVENPGYYFEEDTPQRNRALDLLLMVQGWRRFSWKEMTKNFVLHEPFEVSPYVRGDVSRYTPLSPEWKLFYVAPFDISLQSLSAGVCGPLLKENLMIRETMTRVTYVSMNSISLGETMTSESSEDGTPSSEKVFQPEDGYSIGGDPSSKQFLSKLKNEVDVRAEFTVPFKVENAAAEQDLKTKEGCFSMFTPHSYTPYYMFLMAGKENKKKELSMDAEDYPAFSVRVRPFYPRFVKPYAYYRTQPVAMAEQQDELFGQDIDGVGMMRAVTVNSRVTGLKTLDLNYPATVVDAYDAFNQIVDAGLTPAWFAGSQSYSIFVARCIIGDMDVQRSYTLERRWDGLTAYANMSTEKQDEYNRLCNLHRLSIYTDYAPRLAGDKRYMGAEQPMVTLNIELVESKSKRAAYRDRYYVMPGYSVCDEFYQPDYSSRKMPEGFKDYRRTLYWNPNLSLDENGKAKLSFYNNGRSNQFSVSVQGFADDGTIMVH